MEPKKKTALGLGTALAALFVGASLFAAPASAMMPNAHTARLTTSVFDQRDNRNHDRDQQNEADRWLHDHGNHNGWSKQHDQWAKERERQARERERQAQERERRLREEAKRHHDTHNDRDNHNGRNWNPMPSNQDSHRDGDNGDRNRDHGSQNNTPPPPPNSRDHNGHR